MTRLIASSLFALLLLSLPANADSDGCYCTSKGYIAYELRAAVRHALDPNGDALTAPHVLKVVRLIDGIQEQGQVAMEDFQVHELRCDSDNVTIAGYGDKNWIKYVVDIRLPDQPRITEHVEESFQQHPLVQGPGPTQMYGSSPPSPPEVVSVVPTDTEDTYELVVTHSGGKSGTTHIFRFEYETTGELRQLDTHGNILQHLLLYHDHIAGGFANKIR